MRFSRIEAGRGGTHVIVTRTLLFGREKRFVKVPIVAAGFYCWLSLPGGSIVGERMSSRLDEWERLHEMKDKDRMTIDD